MHYVSYLSVYTGEVEGLVFPICDAGHCCESASASGYTVMCHEIGRHIYLIFKMNAALSTLVGDFIHDVCPTVVGDVVEQCLVKRRCTWPSSRYR